MTLSIRNPRTEQRARELARRTGKSITAVIDDALANYEANHPADDKTERFRRLRAKLAKWDKLPILDPRSAKEIMDDLYDEHGLPK